jgi:FKBP-type peptidyl-prolyl cis-trans isomerase SlyD
VSDVAVGRDTVVGVILELYDAHGALLQAAERPLSYLHGGYGELLEGLEQALEGKRAGEVVLVQLEPEQAFGEYDAGLVRVEDAGRYGDGLQVGMEVEDAFDDGEPRLYRVTDLAAGKAVLDANHPLAGMALRFRCAVVAVRQASAEEVRRGKADSPIIPS